MQELGSLVPPAPPSGVPPPGRSPRNSRETIELPGSPARPQLLAPLDMPLRADAGGSSAPQEEEVRRGEDVVTSSAPPPAGSGRKPRRRRASVEEVLTEMDPKAAEHGLDLALLSRMCAERKFRFTKKELKSEFQTLAKLSSREDGLVDAELAVDWVRKQTQLHRREMRKVARSLFIVADDDNSGFLSKPEVELVATRMKEQYPEFELDPPFDADADFLLMDPDGDGGGVSWDEFERWWAERSGDDEPSCPVLPEAMVLKLDEMVAADAHSVKGWDYLRPRLKMLVTLQKWWGSVKDLYSGSQESLFAKEVLPNLIRHPDSSFTRWWDLLQVFFIAWVAFVMPYRMGFDVSVDIDQFSFWVDTLIDTFFIIDVVLTFRTAYVLPTGFLETRSREIAVNYLRGWFWIDVTASLPLTYITIVAAVAQMDDTDSKGGSLSFAKTLRLVRLAKMLRVARLKRIVGRHASLVEFSAYMNSIFTFILILYLAHLLACCWYWVGTSKDPEGWVVRNDVHNLTEAPHSAKYAASIYTIFKLGDGFAVTPQEQVFAFTSEIAISLIYGALAGVMSTMMMAGSVGEQEYLVKLAQLKAWMKAKHMTTSEKARLMSLFSANHQSSSYYDEQEILSYLPLSVSRDLSIHLYAAIICESPLFANLSTELMQRLCQVIVPQGFAEGTVVYEEGKVGDEMFFVVKGEVEVLKGFGSKRERLGFIGQGGFFGENTVIESVSRRHGTGAAVRMRTMRTTTDSELAMLRCVDVLELCDDYPELEVRLQSFRRAGTRLSRKGAKHRAALAFKNTVAAAQEGVASAEGDAGQAAQALLAASGDVAAAMQALLAASAAAR